LLANNVTVIVAISALHQSDREDLRSTLNRFLEVFLDAPAEVCAQRAGRTDSGFETPHAAELRVPTANRSVAASSAQVISFLEESGVISDASA
jgi:adenylylsulfate kinase-like enzyme